MLETILLLAFCLLIGLISLAIVVWLIVTGEIASMDNILLTLISLTVGGIFTAIFAWSVHTGEFQEALRSLRKGSVKGADSGDLARQHA